MSWAKLDDGFFRHPKARAAGKDGRALFVAGLCWAASHLTDGFIAETDLGLIAAEAEVRPAPTARRLVEVGLWEPVDGGWAIHDYLDYNPSAEAVREKRRKRAEAGRKGGLKSRPPRSKKQAPSEANPEANASANGKRNGTPSPYPSSENKSSSNSRRGGTPDDEGTSSQLNPTIGAAVAVLARHDLDQRQTAPDQPPVTDPAAWERRAYQRRLEAHRSALEAFLEEDPTLTPETLAERVLGPSRRQSGAVNGHPAANGHNDPLAGIQAAARARAERHLRVIHGQACPTCNDTGWRLDPDNNAAVPCPHQTAQEAQ